MATLHASTRGSQRRGRRTIAEINMVPFIDVMLVLLIIFMVTAPLIAPSMIDLPSVGKAAQQPHRVVQVIVGFDGNVKLKLDSGNEQSVNQDQLVSAIKTLLQNAPVPAEQTAPATPSSTQSATFATALANSAVVISADKQVKYEHVVRIMDILQRGGLPRIGLSVQQTP